MEKETKKKVSTKECPKCASKHLVLLRSYNLKICAKCNTRIPWYLDDGQKPLFP
jgi:ribosomal protein L40E